MNNIKFFDEVRGEKSKYFHRIKFAYCILVFIALSFNSEKSFASHSMGSDISYECLGGNYYRIRITFYRDCFGIPAAPFERVIISSDTCNVLDSIQLWPVAGTGHEITPICPSDSTTCGNGNNTGIQQYVYEGYYTFPMQCIDWQMTYHRCCRNQAITTVSNPLTEEMLIYATLNNTISPPNNSPVFSNKPVPFVCLGQQFCFNHGASDKDGDSLAYSLVTPLGYAGIPVTYLTGYSALQPLTSSPPMTFDYVTGDFCMTPQSIEVTVMAVFVSEFRNGVLIGQVERDIQITVIPCTNILPTLSGINGTNSFSATICPEEPFCFNVFSNDLDSGQHVTVIWDHAITGATLDTAGSPHPAGAFCWTPTINDASSVPHCFTVNVHDDNCPYFGAQIYAYCLTVVDLDVDAGPDQYVDCTGLATITASASTSFGNVTYQWSNGPTTASQVVSTGIYTVTVSNGQCSYSDVVEVLQINSPSAIFNAAPVCNAFPENFYDQSTVPGGGSVVSWNWNFDDSTYSSQQNPVHHFTNPGTYHVCLEVTSDLGCIDSVCQDVIIHAPPLISFVADNVCLGVPMTPVNNTNPSDISATYWLFGDGNGTPAFSPSNNYSAPGVYQVTLYETNNFGCTDSSKANVTIYPLPVIDAGNAQDICEGSSATLIAAGGLFYSWSTGDTTQNIIVTPSSYSDYSVIGTDANGCTSTDNVSVNLYPPMTLSLVDNVECDGQSIDFDPGNGGNDPVNTWDWNFGDGTFSSGQQVSHLYSAPGNFQVQLIVISIHGCSDTLNSNVQINPIPTPDAGNGTTICSGAILTIGNPPLANINYNWTPVTNLTQPNSSSTDFNARNNSSSAIDQTYYLTATNQFGCSAVDSVTERILPVPLITFITPSPQCLEGNSFQFAPLGYIDGNSSLSWYFGNSANPQSSPSTSPLTVNFASAGSHLVSLSYSFSGCQGTPVNDTVVVFEMPLTGFGPSPDEGCAPLEVTFTLSNPDNENNYTWQIDGHSIHDMNPTWTFNSAGDYAVTLLVQNENGCAAPPVTVPITVFPVPVASFVNNPQVTRLLEPNIAFDNYSTGGVQYEWNFGDGSSESFFDGNHSYTDTGIFNISLIVISSKGCRDTIFGEVKVEEGFSFYIPNVVTPNGDGINDSFQGYGTFLNSYEMWIYDRWGKLIYKTTDYDKPWDCKMTSVVQNDSYVYRIRVTDFDMKAHDYVGKVSVVK